MPNKYHAVKVPDCQHCGRTHDSKMEAKECGYLHTLLRAKEDGIVHIDVHPTVTLGANVRWILDFCVWRRVMVESGWQEFPRIEAEYIDVKGPSTADFRIKRKLFNAGHPCAPLTVVTWRGGKRVVWE